MHDPSRTNEELLAEISTLQKRIQQLEQSQQQDMKIGRELQQREEMLRLIFDNALHGIFFTAPDGSVFAANRAACQMLGMSETEIYEGGRNAVVELADPGLSAALEERMRTGKFTGELNFRRKDGATFPVEVSSALFSSEKGDLRASIIFRDITDSKQAAEALRKSERKYHKLFKEMICGFALHEIICDDEGNAVDYVTLEVNSAYELLLNVNRADVVNRKASEFLPQSELKLWLEIFAPVALTGESTFYEMYSAVNEKYFAGNVYSPQKGKFAATFIDITERKRAQKGLRESEERFRLAYSTSPDAININRLSDGLYVDINDGFTRLTGFTKEDVIGRTSAEIDIWCDPADRRELVAGLQESGHYENLEALFRRKDGSTTTALMSARIIMLQDIPHILSVTRDISDRKEMENKYRNIFDNAVMGISQLAPDGRYITVNPAYARMFGYDFPEDMIRNTRDIASQTYVNHEKWVEYLKRLREEGYVNNYEMERLGKDGKQVWISVTSRAIKDTAGNILFIESFAKDITEQKILEREFFESQKMEAIGTLAGGIAHDFNNILGAVYGYCDMALIEEDRDQRTYQIQQVLVAADRAKNMVKQILAFSRHQTQEKRPVDLRIVVKEALALIRAMIPTTIEIKQNIANLPCTINADQTQIHQVLMNLCTNALHAMGEKGGILDVRLLRVEIGDDQLTNLRELKPGPYSKLEISDTGCGMESEILERIFHPFFTTKQIGEGTGLGLSVVYGIVTNHDGAVRVASKPAEGSVFTIYLPHIMEHRTAKRADVSESVPDGRGRILFVDDEKALVGLAERMLRSLGYEVTAVASSPEAWQIFLSDPERFDLVITDMTMPHMTGVDLIKKILEVRPQMPVVLCTGFSEYIDEAKADQLGIKALIMKPFSRKGLAKIIREAMGS